ncbi:unnamed protein product, partial [Soboliphyme baturini]|uniref:Ephrin RBD domain-containing protein n=1 Tax=Soboliphyme baturini TaxID=241478 RepID=A0A183IZU8_9BILA
MIRTFVRDAEKRAIVVRLLDSVNIICPQYSRRTPVNRVEQSVIYLVEQRAYDKCMIDNTARLVGLCTTPYRSQIITIVFRDFTPSPSGLEFMPNRPYFLI